MNLKPAIAATAAVVCLSITACGSSPIHSTETTSTTRTRATIKRHTSVDGYPMLQDAKSAVLTRMNTIGVIGEVQQIGDPEVWHLSDETLKATNTDPDDAVNNLVSTPVSVRVTEGLFGDHQVGDLVIFRILGGETADSVTTAEQTALLTRIKVGSTVAAFGAGAVTFSDGSSQTTPDQVFVAEADHFVSALRPDAPSATPTTIDELHDLTKQREEWIATHQLPRVATKATAAPPTARTAITAITTMVRRDAPPPPEPTTDPGPATGGGNGSEVGGGYGPGT